MALSLNKPTKAQFSVDLRTYVNAAGQTPGKMSWTSSNPTNGWLESCFNAVKAELQRLQIAFDETALEGHVQLTWF